MIDFALHPLTRDLILPPKLLDGAARVAQAVGIRLRTWLGEWFLDTSHGVPYLEDVLGKTKSPELAEAILREQILSVAGVRSIINFSLTIDPQTRLATIRFEADSAEGLVRGSVAVRV